MSVKCELTVKRLNLQTGSGPRRPGSRKLDEIMALVINQLPSPF